MATVGADRNRAQRDTQHEWVKDEDLPEIMAYLSVGQGILYVIPATDAGSQKLDQVFGNKIVGEEGLIFEGKCNVRVKLSDGYATHYLSIKREDV